MENKPVWDPAGVSGLKQLNPEDEFQFACTNCCECCRNVKNAVMVEPLDLFRIARYTCRSIEEAVEEFTEPVMLTWGYPILTLKTKPFMDTCVFLKNSRCSIHDANPRACRIYPMIAGPGDVDLQSMIYFLDTKRRSHHTCGSTQRVKEWADKYLTEEDREFVRTDYKFAGEFAKIIGGFELEYEDQVMRLMLLYRYFIFDLEADFNRQFTWNMAVLKKELEKLRKNRED